MSTPDLPTPQIVESVGTLWGAPLQPAGCAQCHQAFLVANTRLEQICPVCANGKLTPQPVLLRSEPPELIIPFSITKAELSVSMKEFVKDVWLRPDDFNTRNLLHRAVPMFWSMWLVDSDVTGDWQAEVCFDYQVKSSQETYSDSGWKTHEVVETRLRWEPRLGQLTRHYDNITVPALSNHQELLDLLGNYYLERSKSFESTLLGGADVYLPDLLPESAWPQAQTLLNHKAADECQQAVGAKGIRNFILHAQYNALNWTQRLLPMYATYYTDDTGRPHPIYVNGLTGKVGGVRLASQRKGWRWAGISLVVAAFLFILSLLLFAALPSLGTLAQFTMFLAFGAVVLAIVPAVWPFQWNRKQREKASA